MPMLHRPEGPAPEDAVLSRRGLAGALVGAAAFAGYAPAALAQAAQPIVTDDAGLVIEQVTCPAPDGFDLPA